MTVSYRDGGEREQWTHLDANEDDFAVQLALGALLGELKVQLARQQDDTLDLQWVSDLFGQDGLEGRAGRHLGEGRRSGLNIQAREFEVHASAHDSGRTGRRRMPLGEKTTSGLR